MSRTPRSLLTPEKGQPAETVMSFYTYVSWGCCEISETPKRTFGVLSRMTIMPRLPDLTGISPFIGFVVVGKGIYSETIFTWVQIPSKQTVYQPWGVGRKWLWIIFTVRKQSCGKVMFSQACVKNSVQGGWCPGPDPGECPGPGPEVGSVSRPGGSVQAQAQGGCPGQGPWGCSGPGARGVCIPACTEADTSPQRWPLLRTVRILLDCILICLSKGLDGSSATQSHTPGRLWPPSPQKGQILWHICRIDHY